jgi:serine/threonine protein phosphatase PrpC
LGGTIDRKNRVQGRLGVTRSLGDFSLNPYVTHEPEIFGPFKFSNEPETKYDILILACDGLWDVVSDSKAVKIALGCSTAQEAAKKLKDKAYNLRSRDNISVLVVFFPGYSPGCYSTSASSDSSTSTTNTSDDGSESGSSGSGSGSDDNSDSDSSDSESGSGSGSGSGDSGDSSSDDS